MSNLDLKKINTFTITLLFIFIIIADIFFMFWREQRQVIKNCEEYIEELQYQKDSLLKVNEQLDITIEELQDFILQTKTKIIYIKEKNNEKVDSIYHLPIDSAIEFFSTEVSKEASSRR